uniref:Large ribosomal subunit protein mL38 n=1 Tax=Cairina moschata TaxID=8855 RepID=A0A8C3CRH8_CAIMO
MPNEGIDVGNLEALEKYRSFTRYFRQAEKEGRKARWWRTYRQYASPEPELKTDISLPRGKLLKVKELKERKKILKQNHQNAEMERAARLRTGLLSYEADKGSLWTLLLTNPDGHLRETDAEYLHWLVTNVPGNDIKAGKEICHYLPPFPAMGTGYHRFVFLLFKQERPIDFSEDVRPTPCHSLKMRTFSTFDFYRKHEDSMTPAGLAFFQCQWDSSVTWVFHQLLNMREPVFEFVRPPVYHPPQVKFPRHQPLRYLDRYRDTKEPTYGIY